MRQLLIFFVLGFVLLSGKRVLLARLSPPPALTVRIGERDRADPDRAIERALLAEQALAAGAALNDPVIRERLITLLAQDAHAAPPDAATLSRSARELDLFHRDLLLETRLAANAELRLKASLRLPSPSPSELEQYLTAHRDRYLRSERFSFTHVLLARSVHAEPLSAARALRARLIAEQVDAAHSVRFGDPCNLPQHVEQSALPTIASRFGSAISAALPGLPLGEWSEPVASPLGAHLLWVAAHQPGRPAQLADVRDKVRADFEQEARAAAFRSELARLRSQRTIIQLPGQPLASNELVR